MQSTAWTLASNAGAVVFTDDFRDVTRTNAFNEQFSSLRLLLHNDSVLMLESGDESDSLISTITDYNIRNTQQFAQK